MLEFLMMGGKNRVFAPAGGQLLFIEPGVYFVEVDAAVSNMSMVVVGGAVVGGGGCSYRNSVSLTKGWILEITVGGASNTALLSQVRRVGSTIYCAAQGPTGINFEIGGIGGIAASSVNTGGGNGGDALYNGAYNASGAGAGGYYGKGGNSAKCSADSLWTEVTPATAGTGGGGGGGSLGKSGSSLYTGIGGGVNLTPPNGTLLNGSAGTYVTTNTTARYGGQGSFTTTTNKVRAYGGGASSGIGKGAVRLMWGSGRSYPNSNTANV